MLLLIAHRSIILCTFTFFFPRLYLFLYEARNRSYTERVIIAKIMSSSLLPPATMLVFPQSPGTPPSQVCQGTSEITVRESFCLWLLPTPSEMITIQLP